MSAQEQQSEFERRKQEEVEKMEALEAEEGSDETVDTEEEPSEEQEAVPSQTSDEIEQEARSQGWRPLEEWKGPEEQWVDAETFVQKGREILPIVQAKYNTLEEKYSKLQKTLERLNKTNESMLKRQQDYYIEQIEKARNEAIEEGDVDAVKAADDKIKQVRDSYQEEQAEESEEHPAITDFVQKNPWYGNDKAMTAYANAISTEIAQNHPQASPEERLEILRSEVRNEFPHKFQTTRKKTPPQVEGASASSRPRKAKKGTYDALPKEAKEACERQINMIPGLTKEDYAREYFAQYPEEAK